MCNEILEKANNKSEKTYSPKFDRKKQRVYCEASPFWVLSNFDENKQKNFFIACFRSGGAFALQVPLDLGPILSNGLACATKFWKKQTTKAKKPIHLN